VSATNNGGRHVRLSSLKLQGAHGQGISYGDGLVGYVLGNSTKSWPIANGKTLGLGATVAITAQSDAGPISASATLQSAR